MFEVHHHARMLADRRRVTTYAQALSELIQEGDCVFDVGCGTGVLAALSSELTSGDVFGFEYLEGTARFAQDAVAASSLAHVHIRHENFFNTTLAALPDLLVTETIGPLGPEENIVEIAAHATRTYPGLRAVIPADLEIFALPIQSPTCQRIRSALFASFASAQSLSPLRFDALQETLDEAMAGVLHTTKLTDATAAGAVSRLIRYQLGVTQQSSFSSEPVPVPANADAVHLYFRASLSPSVSLTSNFEAEPTHWGHTFVLRPAKATSVQVSYRADSKTFAFGWA